MAGARPRPQLESGRRALDVGRVHVSGAGAVWQRARFGTVRPRVQIPGPRPKSDLRTPCGLSKCDDPAVICSSHVVVSAPCREQEASTVAAGFRYQRRIEPSSRLVQQRVSRHKDLVLQSDALATTLESHWVEGRTDDPKAPHRGRETISRTPFSAPLHVGPRSTKATLVGYFGSVRGTQCLRGGRRYSTSKIRPLHRELRLGASARDGPRSEFLPDR